MEKEQKVLPTARLRAQPAGPIGSGVMVHGTLQPE